MEFCQTQRGARSLINEEHKYLINEEEEMAAFFEDVQKQKMQGSSDYQKE